MCFAETLTPGINPPLGSCTTPDMVAENSCPNTRPLANASPPRKVINNVANLDTLPLLLLAIPPPSFLEFKSPNKTHECGHMQQELQRILNVFVVARRYDS
jgi:hypothetical protein